MADEEYRKQCEGYLTIRGWKKDSCGWWSCPFGFGMQEAIEMAVEVSHVDALYWNEIDPEYPYEGPRWKFLDRYIKTYQPELLKERKQWEKS